MGTRPYYDRPRDSLYTAYNLFGVICGTQTPLPQIEAWEHMNALLGSVDSCVYQADSQNNPRMVFGHGNGAAVVAICGAQTLYMFQGLLAGYTNNAADINDGGTNRFATDVITRLGNQLVSQLPTQGRLLIGGYSYGCVIAVGLYAFLRRRFSQMDIRCITYGTPKPGQAALHNFVFNRQGGEVTQYCNDNDPVPFVYPNAEQAPEIHAITRAAESRIESAYDHVYWFTELNPRGEVSYRVALPTRTNGTPSQAIAGWIAGRQGWNTSGHHWTSYKQRLFMASQRLPDVVAESDPGLMRIISEISVAQPLETPYVPVSPPLQSRGDPPQLMAPSPLPAGRPPRGSHGLLVEWNGIPIGRCRTRSEARRLRNTLRRLFTSQKKSLGFEADSVDDALNYAAILDGLGRKQEIR